MNHVITKFITLVYRKFRVFIPASMYQLKTEKDIKYSYILHNKNMGCQ